eukprot:1290213-Amphidinium_carterae.1
MARVSKTVRTIRIIRSLRLLRIFKVTWLHVPFCECQLFRHTHTHAHTHTHVRSGDSGPPCKVKRLMEYIQVIHTCSKTTTEALPDGQLAPFIHSEVAWCEDHITSEFIQIILKMANLMFVVLLINHNIACIWYFLGDGDPQQHTVSAQTTLLSSQEVANYNLLPSTVVPDKLAVLQL